MDPQTRRLIVLLGQFQTETRHAAPGTPNAALARELQALLDHDNHATRAHMKAFMARDPLYTP